MRRAVLTFVPCICLELIASGATGQSIAARSLCRAGAWDAPTTVVASRPHHPTTGVYFKFEHIKYCADHVVIKGSTVTLMGNAMAIDKAGNDTRAEAFTLEQRAAEAFLRELPDAKQR